MTTTLADIALTWLDESACADVTIVDDDVLADQGLRTAVLLSLFTDRRDQDDQKAVEERRGWWGDEFAEVEGDLLGSRLWKLDRSKRVADVVPLAEAYDREALQWMLEDRVAERVDVSVSVTGDRLAHTITVYRPASRDPVTFRFAHAWAGEAARAGGG